MFLPLIWALRHQRGDWANLAKLFSAIAILGALSSMSSGPWGMLMVVLLCMALEKYRHRLKAVLIGFVICCISIQVISNRPFYHPLLEFGNLGKGAWYQRAKLIDVAVERFDEWWLAGYGGEDPGWGPALGMAHTDMNNEFLLKGVQYGMLRVLRGERVGARDLFLGYPKLGHLLLCYFCAVVLGLLGLILLVVPGVILFLGFSQCLLLTLDQGERGLGGLERSWRMMKGFRIRFLGLVLVNVGICLLGLLLLGVGLVPAAAITSLAMVAFYDRVLALHPGLPDAPQRPGPA